MHDIALLAIILASVFVASYLALVTRLTPVLWYLFCGAILVNIGVLPQVMPIFIVDFAELGIIMLCLAELAFVVFVVFDIAYVQHDIISMDIFYSLMLVACLLKLSVPLCINWHEKKSNM